MCWTTGVGSSLDPCDRSNIWPYDECHAESVNSLANKAMTTIDLDRQPEDVRRFFESLDVPPEGLLVVLDGKPLARIFPMTDDDVRRIASTVTTVICAARAKDPT